MIDRMRRDEYGEKANAGQQERLVGRNARYKITDILPIVVHTNEFLVCRDCAFRWRPVGSRE